VVSGFGSGAYSAKPLNGTKHRFSGLSQARQCGEDVFLMFITGYPPARGGGGIPQRIIMSFRARRVHDRGDGAKARGLVGTGAESACQWLTARPYPENLLVGEGVR
jgi:hypothetical protein